MAQYMVGTCSKCGTKIQRRPPASYAVCDCLTEVRLRESDESIYKQPVTVYLDPETILQIEKKISEKRGELLTRYEVMNPKPWENNETWAVFEKEIKKLSLSGFIRESLKEKLREVGE